jgi:hypothetical protein
MFTRAAPHRGREAVTPHVPGLHLEALRHGGDRVGVPGARVGAAGQELAAVLQAEPLLALPVPPRRAREPAGLLASEQIRAVDPEPIQVGLHRLGGLFGARRGVDAHDLEVGVVAGLGEQVAVADLQVPVAGEPAQAPEQRSDVAGAGGAVVGEQERPGVGGGQVSGVADPIPAPGEQIGGELDPPAGGQRSQPAGECVVVLNILRTCVPLYVGRITVRTAPRHALSVRRSKPQLHRFTSEQFGVRREDGGGNPAGLGAGDGGPVRGKEADPAGAVVGSEADDYRETCEDPHSLAGRPIRDLDPKLGEQLEGAAAQIDGDPGDDPVDQCGDHAAGRGGSSGAADPAVEPAQVGEDRRGGAGPGLRQEDPAGDVVAYGVGRGWWALPGRARTPTTL